MRCRSTSVPHCTPVILFSAERHPPFPPCRDNLEPLASCCTQIFHPSTYSSSSTTDCCGRPTASYLYQESHSPCQRCNNADAPPSPTISNPIRTRRLPFHPGCTLTMAQPPKKARDSCPQPTRSRTRDITNPLSQPTTTNWVENGTTCALPNPPSSRSPSPTTRPDGDRSWTPARTLRPPMPGDEKTGTQEVVEARGSWTKPGWTSTCPL